MDPRQRLHLNFEQGFANDGNLSAQNARVYPTTPSTFPQPVFSSQAPNPPNQYHDSHAPSPRLPNPNTYGAQTGGYFGGGAAQQNFSYPQQQQQQIYPNQYQSQQQNIQAPQPTFQQQRQQARSPIDPTSGLAHQFSNQNLDNVPRQPSPFGRQPSPINRAREPSPINRARGAGTPGGQNYGSLLSPGIASPMKGIHDAEPPEKNSEKYSQNGLNRGQGLHALTKAFFQENISRARDRNMRAKELDEYLKSSRYSEEDKRYKKDKMLRAEAQYLRFLRTKESPSDFSTMKIIGKGAFGEVKLVQRKKDAKIYALKSLVKTEMFKKDQLAHVRAERDILAESDSAWVVKMHSTFQDSTYLYMLMEFLPGGDLMTMLIKYEIFSEDITRFYMAEIVLAIEAVHKLGYVHRDIKPDNILLDRGGHIKLTDFGLSTGFHPQHENAYYQQLMKPQPKSNRDNRNSVSLDQINLTVGNRSQINTWRKSRRVMAYSTVGTPDYIAPEIFGGQGYSFGCDWWSVGAIMFECLIGWPPFCAEDAHETYQKILAWQQTLYFPDDIQLSTNSERLIRQLLCDAPSRLGATSSQYGSLEIRAHPFFRGVNFDSLRRIRAPFEPRLTSAVDVSYFPIDEIDQSDHSAQHRAQAEAVTGGERGEGEAEMSLPFIGYTFRRFDAFRN